MVELKKKKTKGFLGISVIHERNWNNDTNNMWEESSTTLGKAKKILSES